MGERTIASRLAFVQSRDARYKSAFIIVMDQFNYTHLLSSDGKRNSLRRGS